MNMPDFACLPLVQTSEKKYRCPRCSKGLDKVCLDEGSNLVIDRCPKGDGLWFDAGELSRSLHALMPTDQGRPSEFINFLGEVFYVKGTSNNHVRYEKLQSESKQGR